jgi:hypothetical protein
MLTVQNNRWKNKETIVAKIREVWAASLDSCKCGQQVVWAASLDSCKCGQQVWTAVLSIDNSSTMEGQITSLTPSCTWLVI